MKSYTPKQLRERADLLTVPLSDMPNIYSMARAAILKFVESLEDSDDTYNDFLPDPNLVKPFDQDYGC